MLILPCFYRFHFTGLQNLGLIQNPTHQARTQLTRLEPFTMGGYHHPSQWVVRVLGFKGFLFFHFFLFSFSFYFRSFDHGRSGIYS